jgi:hypothetical protein
MIGTKKLRRYEGVPNLDGMSKDDLWAFWQVYHRPSRDDAEKLIGDRRKGFTNLASSLANYACNKAVAMGCREKGDIKGALCYEKHADLSYERLPEDIRW